MKSKTRDQRVKALLDQIDQIDGGWNAMLDILHVRGVQKTMREARILQGMSREDLATRLDVAVERVEVMENERYPDYHLSTLRRWSMALGLLTEWQMTPVVVEEEQQDEAPAP